MSLVQFWTLERREGEGEDHFPWPWPVRERCSGLMGGSPVSYLSEMIELCRVPLKVPIEESEP